MQVDIYSDIACPWCYVGKKRFEAALAAFEHRDEVTVNYHAFQLDPTLPATAADAFPLARHLEAKFGNRIEGAQQRLADLAGPLGIEFHWERALAANTLEGHRLIWLAGQVGGSQLQGRMKEALLRAYFSEGANMADPEALLAIAASNGLDPERARACLASDEGQAEVQAQLDEGRALGISGVPTYVFEGQWAVSGAQEVGMFLQALRHAEMETAGGPL